MEGARWGKAAWGSLRAVQSVEPTMPWMVGSTHPKLAADQTLSVFDPVVSAAQMGVKVKPCHTFEDTRGDTG